MQSRTLDDFVDAGRVYSHFADGATIVLQALHRYWEPLFHFTRGLELAFTHPVQVNTYLTPPRAKGLDVHYDTHDVFVLQVSGTKLWRVFGSAVDLPLAHQRRKGEIADPGPAQINVELHPGDCLYIPRGFLHAAETTESESTHMTVGILVYRWMDLINAAMERAADEGFIRDALPVGFAHSPDALGHQVKDKFVELAGWLNELDASDIARSFADRFWSNRAPLLTGQLQQVLTLGAVTDESLVRRRRSATCALRVEDEEVVVVLGDRRLYLPAHIEPALWQIADSPEFKVAELDGFLDHDGRIVLVRRLIKEGLLEQVPR